MIYSAILVGAILIYYGLYLLGEKLDYIVFLLDSIDIELAGKRP